MPARPASRLSSTARRPLGRGLQRDRTSPGGRPEHRQSTRRRQQAQPEAGDAAREQASEVSGGPGGQFRCFAELDVPSIASTPERIGSGRLSERPAQDHDLRKLCSPRNRERNRLRACGVSDPHCRGGRRGGRRPSRRAGLCARCAGGTFAPACLPAGAPGCPPGRGAPPRRAPSQWSHQRRGNGVATGSGFVQSNDRGHIVTNDHVLAGGSKITVASGGATRSRRAWWDGTPWTDLALLRVRREQADEFRPLPLGSSRAVRVGDIAVAVGDPFASTGRSPLASSRAPAV